MKFEKAKTRTIVKGAYSNERNRRSGFVNESVHASSENKAISSNMKEPFSPFPPLRNKANEKLVKSRPEGREKLLKQKRGRRPR